MDAATGVETGVATGIVREQNRRDSCQTILSIFLKRARTPVGTRPVHGTPAGPRLGHPWDTILHTSRVSGPRTGHRRDASPPKPHPDRPVCSESAYPDVSLDAARHHRHRGGSGGDARRVLVAAHFSPLATGLAATAYDLLPTLAAGVSGRLRPAQEP